MSFENLPRNVRSLPLTDPQLAADVVDLMVSERDRVRGCVAVMMCDNAFRGEQPVVVNDVPEGAEISGLLRLLDLLLPMVGEGGGILVGRGRRRGTTPTDTDRAWHQATIDACAAAEVRLLGYHLASLDGISALPAPIRAGS